MTPNLRLRAIRDHIETPPAKSPWELVKSDVLELKELSKRNDRVDYKHKVVLRSNFNTVKG
jgi:hypothetical protein